LINTKKILLISNHYLTFVKDQNEIISKSVSEINALIRINYYYHLFGKNNKIDLAKTPINIFVKETPVFYYPVNSQYKKLGKWHFNAVEKAILKKSIEFDLIHSHFTWSSGYVGAKLKEKYDVPFIVTAHGYDIYDLPFRDDEWKTKIEYVLNTADCIITVSNSNLRCIEKLDVDTPVKVIPNGFNDKIFYPINSEKCRKTLNLPINKKIILTVGNLVGVKGHKYLIEAMREVVKHEKNVLCIIVGSGNLKNKLENQIHKCGLKDHIKLVGGAQHSEIPIWMNACDVFVLPSLRESFGVVQIEAMSCGKPVVATCNGGSEEIIVSENHGFLIPPGNSKELGQSILRSLDKTWDENEIRSYAEQFAWDQIVNEIIDIYEKI